MTYQLPGDQISRLIDWNTWEELECRGREEVVVSYSADGGVGIEAGYDGVAERCHDASRAGPGRPRV